MRGGFFFLAGGIGKTKIHAFKSLVAIVVLNVNQSVDWNCYPYFCVRGAK